MTNQPPTISKRPQSPTVEMPSESPTNTLEWATRNAKRQLSLGTSLLRPQAPRPGSKSNRHAKVLPPKDADPYYSFPAFPDAGSEPADPAAEPVDPAAEPVDPAAASGTFSPEPLRLSRSRSSSLHDEEEVKESRTQNLIKSFGNLFSRKVRRHDRPASMSNQKKDRILSLMQMPRRHSNIDPQGTDDRRTVSDPPKRPMSRNSVLLTRETATAEPPSPVRHKTMERTRDRLRRHLPEA
ncbi:hypothetical protein F5X68DRAFT_193555 [Plectosphaerella plurivora]|uniref:Uncharacterized protein n=1 Tax=Plectosphaerella plurivora TaxID=936078 RepID=A0A9P8V5X3_9PEZI|nr:hypothetical protein F5X68DRAFT_193555 [Plectosphaerella plurivora]